MSAVNIPSVCSMWDFFVVIFSQQPFSPVRRPIRAELAGGREGRWGGVARGDAGLRFSCDFSFLHLWWVRFSNDES